MFNPAPAVRKIDHKKMRRVLIVDAIAVHRVVMSSLVSGINPFITFEQASSVAEAISTLGRGHFDAVVADWNLPGQGGDVLLKWIRARAHFNRLPFIMVSSSADNQDIIHAFMTLGVDAYVIKPFKAQDLYQKLVTTFDNRSPEGGAP